MKQARTELTQTSTQFPDLPEARLQIAALDLQEKNFKAAEDSFRTLYGKFQDPRAFMGLVETSSPKATRRKLSRCCGMSSRKIRSGWNIGSHSRTSR